MPLNRPIGSDDGIYGYFLPGASGYHGRHMGSILLKNGSPSRECNTTATLKLAKAAIEEMGFPFYIFVDF